MTGIGAELFLFISRSQLPKQLPFQLGLVGEFAFPYNQHMPPESAQRYGIQPVTSSIAGKFGVPKLGARFWQDRILTPNVLMPEAPMDEHNCPSGRQHNIRFSGQPLSAQREPKAQPVQKGPDPLLRASIAALYAAHIPTSSLRRQFVCHRWSVVQYCQARRYDTLGLRTRPLLALWPCGNGRRIRLDSFLFHRQSSAISSLTMLLAPLGLESKPTNLPERWRRPRPNYSFPAQVTELPFRLFQLRFCLLGSDRMVLSP
jgi:hypothetical protein